MYNVVYTCACIVKCMYVCARVCVRVYTGACVYLYSCEYMGVYCVSYSNVELIVRFEPSTRDPDPIRIRVRRVPIRQAI